MSPAWRGGCVGAVLLFAGFCALMTFLAVVYGQGKSGAIVLAFVMGPIAAVTLWVGYLMARDRRLVLEGTVLSYKLPLRKARSCDLAQVTSARVGVDPGSAQAAPGVSIAAPTGYTLRLEGGGDLTSVPLREGFRWPRAQDMQHLIAALGANENPDGVLPAITALEQLARGRPRHR